jgi:hypothetical protein
MQAADPVQWKRAWVVQECVFARNATVIYGEMRAPWSLFARAADRYALNRIMLDMSQNTSDPLALLTSNILNIEGPRRIAAAGHSLAPLETLHLFRERLATDPRDKVYALLGLMDQPPIEPDYDKLAETLMVDVALAIVARTGRLDILAGDRPLGIPLLPSWSVDWRKQPLQDHQWQRLQCLRLYHAPVQPRSSPTFHRNSMYRILGVKGCKVDEVHTILEGALPTQGYGRMKASVVKWRSNQRLQSISGYDVDFWRVLCGDMVHTGATGASDTAFRRANRRDEQTYTSWLDENTEIQARRKTSYYGDLVFKYVPDAGASQLRNSFFYALQTMTAGRKMFVTQEGRIGVGPAEIRLGDSVVILDGSAVPLLLRRTQTSECSDRPIRQLRQVNGEEEATRRCNAKHYPHLVVGDCYVTGYMDDADRHDRKMATLDLV